MVQTRSGSQQEGLASDAAEAVFGERLYGVKEVARLFGIKPTTVREWITRGELLAIRVGKEYRVSQTALRQYRADKEAQAQRERETRLQEVELVRRRTVDPTVHWALTYCVGCGCTATFSTRDERLSGQVFCSECRDYPLRSGQSREAYRRRIALRVAEWNAMVDVERGEEDLPTYVTYHCGVCRCPQVLTRWQVKDPAFYPFCDHSEPFPDYSEAEAAGQYDRRVVDTLARLEFQVREEEQREGPLYSQGGPWLLEACTRCEVGSTVVQHDDRSKQAHICRTCYRAANTVQPAPEARPDAKQNAPEVDNLDDVPF
jgi:excisionase family DNA binding protein